VLTVVVTRRPASVNRQTTGSFVVSDLVLHDSIGRKAVIGLARRRRFWITGENARHAPPRLHDALVADDQSLPRDHAALTRQLTTPPQSNGATSLPQIARSGDDDGHRRVELAEAAQHPTRRHLVFTCDTHRRKHVLHTGTTGGAHR
jgi:hypothetical protein